MNRLSTFLPITLCGAALLLAAALTPTRADEAAEAALAGPADVSFPADGKIDFDTHVRPIFEASCVSCHTAGKKKGGLRLDAKKFGLAGGKSGAVIKPGDAENSRLVRRVLGLDNERQMPLKAPPLPEEQVEILKAWIDQGAEWPDDAGPVEEDRPHWAFVKPVRHEPPAVGDVAWVRNPIDNFILARLEQEGLSPSPEADKVTLIRRLSLDLIGLPPTPEEVDAFVADESPEAYETLVERLLASPHYGERWARQWLDVARYADTNGYEKDRPRTIWPYRDWVIDALNADMPFDQFTVEQIAGDMLPDATPGQVIATGFHRNTMTNEEGGIDVEEFRYKAVVDRVQTTATAWLGLTMQCAQCHDHKYDPFSQEEYFGLHAMLNNADEPEYKIPSEEITSRRRQIEAQIAQIESELEAKFPVGEQSLEWTVLQPKVAASVSGATLTVREDGSVIVSGAVPATDSYTIEVPTDLTGVVAFRLEALTDPSLTKSGPGRQGADNGNFVLSEFKVTAAPAGGGEAKAVALHGVEADFSQPNFPASAAADGDANTGWAIDDSSGSLNKNRTITFRAAEPVGAEGGTTLVFTLDQNLQDHTLGCFRISAGTQRGEAALAAGSEKQRRADFLDSKLAEWERQNAPRAGNWTLLQPAEMTSRGHATITLQDDGSVLVSGDIPNNDVYTLGIDTDLDGITALRVEVLPHDSLPMGGPGRAPLFSDGDFLLSEIELAASPLNAPADREPANIRFASASHDYATANRSAADALDGRLDTGWQVAGKVGEPHRAVFVLAEPLPNNGGSRLTLKLLQEYIHQMTIGRFRIWATTDPQPAAASELPAEVEAVLVTPADRRTDEQRQTLKKYYLSVAPELSPEHQRIAELKKSMPRYQTTLVMQERLPQHTRKTVRYHRGEFLHPREEVPPGVPAVLHPLPQGAKPDRLGLARWLVSEDNPLVGRVVMNRAWAAFFGRGIVNTPEDFGIMGQLPTHPELLDWLATEFVRQGWSMKAMHRLIVTSSTYRQSSHVTPKLLERDPENRLLARGPRFRVEAETVRDIALAAAGLLDRKVGGPSVYPPQPEGVSELSYGATPWPTSQGGDRWRRGMYTYLKRTSPYPGLITFDAPTSDVVCVRRVRSNTPLQALTVLNDAVFVEAAQALARRVVAEGPADAEGRARLAFRLCVAREADEDELAAVVKFYDQQLARFQGGELDAAAVATSDAVQPPAGADLPDLAAWTAVGRVLLNLDETITKE